MVAAENRPLLTKLLLPGKAADWETIGFALSGASFQVGQVTCAVGASGPGWGFNRGVQGSGGLCGIVTEQFAELPSSGRSSKQPNGTSKIDHVVVVSKAPSQTKTAFELFGLVGKGARLVGAGDSQRSYCFFWSGELLIELVGPAIEQHGASPEARIWGVTFVVDGFEPLRALGDAVVSGPRAAVQPGRQIATLARQQGIGIALAFISPHVKGSGA